jgi:uncharacterized membrane protein YkoI
MVRFSAPIIAGALLVASAALANAQQGVAVSSKIDPKLAAAAKITLDSARVIALRAVPHSTVASEELEREHGRLIYSFDMKVAKREGIQEVNVNAITGKVIGVHHETAAAERQEKRAEMKAGIKDSSGSAKP